MAYGTIKVDTITFTDAGVDKSVTISGLVQNPTFSGNITVTGTVSGNTIQGQTVSGATITGGAAAFTTVTGGVATITSGVFALGSASNPSISFNGDANSGLYSPGADQVAISTGGSGRLFVDASGNVGVGTASPGGALDVVAGNTSNYAIIANNSNASGDQNFLQFKASSTVIGDFNRPNGTNDVEFNAGFGAIAFGTGTAGTPTERLRITSAGLVGIGTSSVTHALTVTTAGTDAVKINTADYGYLDLSNGTSTVRLQNVANVPRIGTATNHPLVFAVNEIEGMRLTSTGLGIGTTSPSTALDVSGELTFSAGGAGWRSAAIKGIDEGGSFRGGMAFYTHPTAGSAGAPTERVRIDSSGRLLVGTSTARANFFNSSVSAISQVEEVGGGSAAYSAITNVAGATGPAFVLGKTRGTSAGSNTVVNSGDQLGTLSFQGSDGSEFVEGAIIRAEVDGTPGANDMPGRLVFSTTPDGASSPLERLRITSGGAISCGPQVSGADLVGTEACGFVADGVYAPVYKIKSSLTSDKNAALFFNGNGQVGGILMSGSSTAYNTSSDYRLKENVAAVTDGITRLQQLKPSRFNFIADPTKTVDGFIAHEAQAVVPECVSGEKDAVDDDGNPVYQGIDQSKLVPLLTAALQEAIGEIESLKARVVALESKP